MNTFERHITSVLRAPPISRRPRISRGFTMVELLVGITVSATLLMVAAPSMSSLFNSVRLSSASNIFVSGLFLARGEAIKRNSRVVLCKSTDGERCESTRGWSQGWIVFHDADNNGTRENTETIIHREAALAPSIRFTGNLNLVRYVSFAPTGVTKLVGGGFQAGTLTICNSSPSPGEARQIIVNAAGRPKMVKTTVSSCA